MISILKGIIFLFLITLIIYYCFLSNPKLFIHFLTLLIYSLYSENRMLPHRNKSYDNLQK